MKNEGAKRSMVDGFYSFERLIVYGYMVVVGRAVSLSAVRSMKLGTVE